jgi:uncharacterized protein YbjT (DUF2867 family)
MRLVVFGASGATGQHVVNLAAKAGWSVRAVVRSEPQRHALTDAGESTVGDPTDLDSVATTISGADAVAVCLGISRRTRSPFAPLVSPPDLTSRSIGAIVQAMQRAGVRRIVYVSAFGAGDSWSQIPWWGRAFLRLSQVRHSMADHTRSESLLSSSALDWTALRPMLLDDASGALPAREMRPGDSLLAKLSRESLARTIVAVLGDPSTHGRTVPLVPAVTRSPGTDGSPA